MNKNAPLPGAVFKITNGSAVVDIASNGTGVIVEPKVVGETVTIENNTFTIPEGGVTVKNLKASEDIYSIVEVNPPAGYVITNNTPATFKISAGNITEENHIQGVTYAPETKDFTIPNEPGKPLPHTGGCGTGPICLIGALFTTFAGAALVMKKRRNAA